MKKSLNAKLFSILLASGFLIWVTSQNSAQAAGLVCYSLASGGAWSNPNTWGNSPVGVPGSCPGVPGVGDTAAIVGSGVVTVSGAVSVDVLSISDGTSLSGTSGGKVTILNASSPSTWTSSSFGFTLTDVEIELGTGTSLSIVGSGPATLAGNAKISALSGVTITQNLPISMSPTAEIKLSSGATLHAGADIFGDPAGTSKITNDGTINFNGINIGDVSFDNGGIINCDALCSISLSAANTFAMLMSPAVLSGDGQITKLNTLTLAAGTVSIKTITAPLVNNTGAQLNPSAGSTTVARSMTINGDYDQGILGSFRSYLYNSTRDLITVTGTANLGGFHLKGTFGPQQGTGYFHDVFTAGTLNIVGGFPANPGYGFTGDQNLFRTTSDAQSGNSFRITYTGSAYSVEDNGDVASPTLKTLRSAITDIANDSSCIGSPYKIIFYLPGGTIQPATPLPNLGTCVTTLDGFTNLGASADTNGARDASTAVYTFSLDGTSCGASCNGLRVAGPNSVEITGMHITNFATSAGIAVDPTAGITQLYGNKLVGNNFGVFHDGAPGLEIGADVVGKKNIIYSNLDSGIHSINQLASTTQSLFVNNLIGVTADGVTSAGNGNNGIWVNGSNEIFISASIIANSQKGVNITGTSQRVELDLNAAGGSPNVIYGNSIIGVDLNGDGPTPNDPAVALDADTGPNGLSNYAVITGVTFPTMTQTDVSISIAGKPSTQYEVLVCQNPPGESQCRNPLFSHLLLTNGAGIASTLVATAYYAPPWSATAIATALDGPEPGNSSEISPAFAVAAPDVTVAPATLTFSETNGNTTAPQTVTVTNSTALPITITSITPPPGFVIFSNSCGTTIPASPATCTLQIQYTASPTNTGGTLAINHSGGGSPTTVTVTGATAIPDVSATPAGLTFAGTVGNQSAAQTVTITNITMPPGTLNLSAFATTGPFSITGNTCGATLAAGASCTAMVAFTATGTGFIMGDAFSFMFNTFNASVALSGTGSQAPQTITGFAPATPVLLSSISQTLSATGGLSGNPIVFASTTPSTCTVAGNVLTYVLAGPCTVTANQAGNANYLAATTATATITLTTIPPPPTPLSGVPSFTPPVIGTNGESIYKLIINNSDTVPATGLTVNISPTLGATFTATVISNTCGGTASKTTTTLSLSGGTVPATGSCFITAGVTSPTVGLYNLDVPVGALTSNIGGQVSFVTATLSVQILPNLVATPAPATTINFGSVVVTSPTPTVSAIKTVTLQNTGSAAITLSKSITGANASLFSAPDSCAGTINPASPAAGTCVFSLTCSPTATGNFTATLSITHNAPNIPSPINYPLQCTGGTPPPVTATLTPTTANLGNVAIGESRTQTFTYANTSTSVLTITGITVSGTGFSRPASTAGGSCPASSGTLTAGTSCTVILQYSASTLGAATGGISIASNAVASLPAATASPHTAALSAQVIPVFTMSPATSVTAPLNFGNVALNTISAAQTITVTNNKTTALTLSGFAAPPRFAMTASSPACNTSIAAQGSCSYSFTFAPTAVGVVTAAPQFSTDASVAIVFNLRGEGIAALVPGFSSLSSTAAFGNQPLNSTGMVNIVINNSGNAPLALLGVMSSNPQFMVTSTPAAGPTNQTSQSSATNTADTTKSGSTASASAPSVTANIDPVCVISPTATSTLAPGSSCIIPVSFSPTSLGPVTATLSITHNGVALPATSAVATIMLSGSGVPALVPQIQITPRNPSSINFGTQIINTTSTPAQTVTVSNVGTAPLNILGASINNSQFSRPTGTAGGNCVVVATPSATTGIAQGASCTINLVFTPNVVSTAPNGTVGVLSITHDAVPAPTPTVPAPTSATALIDLVGTGIAAPAPQILLDPLSLAFGDQIVNETSPARTITVRNIGNANLVLASITITGGNHLRPAGASGGTCAVNTPIAPQQSCTLTLTFNPTTLGDKVGAVVISSNATNGVVTNPGSVSIALTGKGIAKPVAGLLFSARNLNFGEQTLGLTSTQNQTITVNNNGTANLLITRIIGSGDFGFQSDCPIAPDFLIPAARCSINVNFTPVSLGQREGSIVVESNAVFITAEAAPNRVTLIGVGTPVPVPALQLDTTSLRFGSQTVGTQSDAQAVVLTNIGLANLLINGTTLNGDANGNLDFVQSRSVVILQGSGTPPCGSSLAPGASCFYGFSFVPQSEGAKLASFSINTNLATGPTLISLSGTATPRPRPAISITPTALNMGDQIVTTPGATRTIIVANTGDAPLSITAITVSGANAVEFALPPEVIPFSANPSSNPTNARCFSSTSTTAGSVITIIAPRTDCVFFVAFNPTSEGQKSARINILSDATNTASVNGIDLTANATPIPVPRIKLSSTALGFGNSLFIAATQTQTITLSSEGTAPLLVNSILATGDFVQTHNCPTTMLPGTNCRITVSFSPLNLGSRTGELQVRTNATPTTSLVVLSGTSCRWFSLPGSRIVSTLCAP